MVYLERSPGPLLSRFVHSIWYARVAASNHRRERIVPNGCSHFVFALSRDFLCDCSENGPDKPTAPALVVGQRSTYEIVATADLAEIAGVLFAPGALPAIIGDRADLLSNRALSLGEVLGADAACVRHRLLAASSPDAILNELESYLEAKLLAASFELHPAVAFALHKLSRPDPGTSIADLAKQSGWSERRFSQLFREHVGFTPKVWHRLQRFQRALRAMRTGVDVPWSRVAADCGFYDQAHLANEFRSFSGIDLSTYKSRAHQLWANHAQAD